MEIGIIALFQNTQVVESIVSLIAQTATVVVLMLGIIVFV